MKFSLLLLPCLLLPCVLGKTSEELLVRLDHGGGVTGHYMNAHKGRGLLAFTNIFYAEAPVGPLRFQDPVKKAPWQGFLPNNKKNIFCPQRVMFALEFLDENNYGDEDCLVLNVFVPHKITKMENKTLPVMVFIHGGGFNVGSGTFSMIGPEYILDEDVILVTLNYRLGPLGFLTTFKDSLTGNWGMKDQQLALQWVQENIHSFHGNKDQVTIFGVSAGGASVGFHMMAPKSAGLFHRAIMQSGTPYDSWALQDKDYATSKAKKFFKLVKCDAVENDPAELMKCLRAVPMKDIVETAFMFFDWHMDPLTPFGVVLEENDSPTPFVQEMKVVNTVPLMIGVAHDEGAFKTAVLQGSPTAIADLEANLTSILPLMLCYSHMEDGVKVAITEKIQEFYLKGKTFDWDKDKHTLTTIVSDGLFIAGFFQFLRHWDHKNEKPFVYLFNYRGATSLTDILTQGDDETNWGVSHGDDMMYMFPTIRMASTRTMTDDDLNFGSTFVRLLTTFGKFSDSIQVTKDLSWNRMTEDNFNYLRIGNCNREKCPSNEEGEMQMEEHLFSERMIFWKDLGSIYKSYWEKNHTE